MKRTIFKIGESEYIFSGLYDIGPRPNDLFLFGERVVIEECVDKIEDLGFLNGGISLTRTIK